MRLANRALIGALITLMLCAAVSAQTLRNENDPRNQSPSVGTGGPPGGPTGLFTIYDGSTLRKGEFTFSVAYSNYDRDPGNADFADIPLSFNVGLNDYIELFFNTNGYRGLKINAPQNLSGFYLPNTRLLCNLPGGCSGAAIILAPTRVSGPNLGAITVFRPANNQPFVGYPFAGGTGPNLGLTGSAIAPPFVSILGPFNGGGGGHFGTASNFPGVGSSVGSILPGIVLTTRTIPATATVLALTGPGLFTIAPTYLPDAPFISREYGESSFTNTVIGAKFRFTEPDNALGVGLIPFYRWYWDNAEDAQGFNQMQRGAGPGADIGDFGLVLFVDGRLSRSVNLSANLGYIVNSNPKTADGFTLLDRPNEVLAGIAFDFPVNKHFQPVLELRSTQYVSGRTPNALSNNPVDALAGIKIYPRRWWGMGAAYRIHLNSQSSKRLEGAAGFRNSEDPHGFIAQFWAGHRNARMVPKPPNVGPTVSVSGSMSSITLPCPEGTTSATCTPSASREVTLTAMGSDPDGDTLLYAWSVTGGRITGDGRSVAWDLSGVNPGTYTATVEVNDGNTHTANASTAVTVAVCDRCEPPCPTVSVSCQSDVDQGAPITFTASVSGGPSNMTPTYNWSVSAGTISGGQGTSSITVDTAGLGGQSVTATIELGGVDPACARTASCTTSVKVVVPVTPTKFDEYGNIAFNDEKARLDNYAIQLQNEPGATGYIIAYGSCEGEGQARADRAKNYLVNTRGIEAGRITTLDGGCRAGLTVQLWTVPSGATPPAASADDAVSPCPACKKTRTPRRRRGRDDE